MLVMFAHNNFENWCLWKEVYHNWENAQMLAACWLEFGAYVLLLVCVEMVNLVCMHVFLHSKDPLSFIGEIRKGDYGHRLLHVVYSQCVTS